MSSSRCLISYDRDLSAEEDEILLKTAIRLSHRFVYHKLKANQYECTCSVCGQSRILTKHQLDMVRESGLCLWCAEFVKTSPEREEKAPKREWVEISNEGYSVWWWKKEGKIYHRCDHVAHFVGDTTYVKGIVKNFGTLIDSHQLNYWRKTRTSYGSYSTDYRNYFSVTYRKPGTKKEYYTNYADSMPTLKSNQLTFIKEGIYNLKQIAAIHMFDLNTPDQVHKYKTLIKRNSFRQPKLLPVLNPTFADYLQRNNYTISDFMDYYDMCRELDQKVEKPKDLYEAHQRQIQQKRTIELEEHRKKVEKRYSELKKHELKKGSLAVKAFDTVEKVQDVANTLNNCIARVYLPRYCDSVMDLYYGTKDGKFNFALEVAKGKVIQLRAKNNREVDQEVAQFVKRWAKKEGYEYAV